MRFTKRQLIDQIGFTAEEAKIILEYQKLLPVLVENDGIEGFCVDIRELYKQILQTTDMSNFSRWFNRAVKNYGFEEGVDFTSISPIGRNVDFTLGGDIKSIERWSTIEASKEFAMVSKTETGKITRRYFILMEKAVRRMSEWESVRNPMKKGYNDMKDALNRYMVRNIQREADSWDYSIEANALNIIATGFEAKDIRLYLDCQDDVTRDSLNVTYNHYLEKLQEWNILLLDANKNRYERYATLSQYFHSTFPNAVSLVADEKVAKINENRRKLLEETKSKVYGD